MLKKIPYFLPYAPSYGWSCATVDRLFFLTGYPDLLGRVIESQSNSYESNYWQIHATFPTPIEPVQQNMHGYESHNISDPS